MNALKSNFTGKRTRVNSPRREPSIRFSCNVKTFVRNMTSAWELLFEKFLVILDCLETVFSMPLLVKSFFMFTK
jgi:hypothetical protein